MCTLTLSNGKEITNLVRNGDNFISRTRIDECIFRNNLSTLTIEEDGVVTQIMYNAELIQQIEYNGDFWFCFREMSDREMKDMAFQAQIDYISMMADIDI